MTVEVDKEKATKLVEDYRKSRSERSVWDFESQLKDAIIYGIMAINLLEEAMETSDRKDS